MSLLSKSEIQYLQGQKQVSKSYEYKLKSIISRKVSAYLQHELPLLARNHYMDLDTFNCLGKAKVVGPNATQGFLYGLKEGQFGDIEEQPNGNTILPDFCHYDTHFYFFLSSFTMIF